MAMNAARLAEALLATSQIEPYDGESTDDVAARAMRAMAEAIINEVKQATVTGTAASVTAGADSASVTGTLT